MRFRRLFLCFALFGAMACAADARTPDPLKTLPSFSPNAKLKIALVGDSTVTDDAGWGAGFADWISDGAECINLSRGGRSSGSFVSEGRWKQAIELKPDFVLIQFGHNDQPGHEGRESDPETTFRANMMVYVDQARAAGIQPVLMTSLSRRQWGDDAMIHSTLAPYAEAVRKIAKEKQVPLIDLHDRSIDFYQSLGRDAMKLISPTKENGDLDGTHLNARGGKSIGAIVAYEMRNTLPETERYLNNWRGRPTTAPAAPQTNSTTSSPATAPTTAPTIAPANPNAMPPNEFATTARQSPPAPTSKGAKTLIVARDGSGDARTIQEAIDAAPANNSDRTTIRIKPGVYYGCTVVPRSKPNLSFVGDDAATTILTFALNVGDPVPANVPPGMGGYGVIVFGDGFRAENVTFQNTSGDHGQAIALRLQADRCVIRKCRLLGWQDTLRVHSKRQYFADCHIEGRVDFIYGASTAVFKRCEIKSKRGGFVTAANTDPKDPWGLVFFDCRLTSDDNVPAFLGRPWRPNASVTFVRCALGSHIKPEGWDNWGNPENEKTARYAEYQCTGPGAERSARVTWSRELTAEQAANLSLKTVFGDWDPTLD